MSATGSSSSKINIIFLFLLNFVTNHSKPQLERAANNISKS